MRKRHAPKQLSVAGSSPAIEQGTATKLRIKYSQEAETEAEKPEEEWS